MLVSLPQEFLDLADFLLKLADVLFVFAFGFQLGIHNEFSDLLLEFALHLVERAFRLVLGAGFHDLPPVGFLRLSASLPQIILRVRTRGEHPSAGWKTS